MNNTEREKIKTLITNLDNVHIAIEEIGTMYENESGILTLIDDAGNYPFSESLCELVVSFESWVDAVLRQCKMLLFADELYSQCYRVSDIMDGDLYFSDMEECLEMVVKAVKNKSGIVLDKEEVRFSKFDGNH